MTDALASLTYLNGETVRIFGTAHEPWFAATDVCKILGIQNPPQAVAGLPTEDMTICKTYDHRPNTRDNGHGLILISEPGLYRLIFRSNKPNAVRFQNWVFREVLPALRKTGEFSLKPTGWQELYQAAKSALADGDSGRGGIAAAF